MKINFICLVTVLSWIIPSWAFSSEALQLTELSKQLSDFIIRITDGDLQPFTGIRDYYTLVVITSTSQTHGCQVCQKLMPVIQMVSKNFFKDYLSLHSLYFVEIDLIHSDNFNIANAIGLTTVPHIWLVPPTTKETYDPFALVKEPHFIFKLPVGSVSKQALELAQMLSQTLNKSIYLRDDNPMMQFALYFIVTFLAITVLKRRGPKIVTNLGKPFAYRILSIGAILTSITGYQFTKIKKIPFIARNEQGIMFISGGNQYQFGTEIILVGGVYTLLGISFLLMVYLGNYKPHDQSLFKLHEIKLLIMIDCVVLYCLYGVLTSIALRKDPDYPYYFAKFF